LFIYIFFTQQGGQSETRNAADSEDSFTKQQFDIIQQIMHHTQQQIATSNVSKNSNLKNSSNAKNWNNQQVRKKKIMYYIIIVKFVKNISIRNRFQIMSIWVPTII